MTPRPIAPLLIWIGNSQGCTNPWQFLSFGGAPEFAPLAAKGTTPATLDSRKMIWHTRTQSWEVLDVERNASSGFSAPSGKWGLATLLSHYAMERWGSCWLIDLSSPGSTAEWAAGTVTHGTWDPDVPETQTGGPALLRHMADREIRAAVGALEGWGMVAKTMLTGCHLGENDTGRAATFGGKLAGITRWLRASHGHGRLATEAPAMHILPLLSMHHPGGTDEQVAQIRAAQSALADQTIRLVAPGGGSQDHRFEPESTAGPRQYPRTQRQHHGTHLSGAALLDMARQVGDLIDAM